MSKSSAVVSFVQHLALALAVVLPLTAPLANAGETKLRTKLLDTFEQGHGSVDPFLPSSVASLALSPDGTLLATGGGDKTVKLWDVARRRVIATLRGHAARVRLVAFSADGKTLFSASNVEEKIQKKTRLVGMLKLWDVATGKNLATLEYPDGHVSGLAGSPDGTHFAVATGGTIEIVDFATRKPIASLGKKKDLNAFNGSGGPIAFSSDGKTLVAGPFGLGNNVKVWDVAGRELKADLRIDNGGAEWTLSLALSPDGKSVVATRPLCIEVWDVATGKQKQKKDFHDKREERVRGLYVGAVLANDGKTLVGFSRPVDRPRKVIFWDVASQKITAELDGDVDIYTGVAVSRDGKTIAGVNHSNDEIKGEIVQVWDVARAKRTARMVGRTWYGARGLFFRPDGKVLVSTHDPFSFFWEVPTGKNLLSFPPGLTGVAFASDNKTFFCSAGGLSRSSHLELHELATGEELRLDEYILSHKGMIQCMASTHDGKTLATGSDDKTIRIWDVAGLKKKKRQGDEVLAGFKTVQILTGHADEVRFVTFSKDGKRLASASTAGDFKLWDVASGKELSTLLLVEPGKEKADVGVGEGRGSPVAISRDFKTVALGTRTGEVKLWDVGSGKILAKHQVLKGQAVTALALSPDGKTLATAGGDSTIQLWDVASGKSLASLKAHTAVVHCLVWSPTDPILASAGANADATINLWEIVRPETADK